MIFAQSKSPKCPKCFRKVKWSKDFINSRINFNSLNGCVIGVHKDIAKKISFDYINDDLFHNGISFYLLNQYNKRINKGLVKSFAKVLNLKFICENCDFIYYLNCENYNISEVLRKIK